MVLGRRRWPRGQYDQNASSQTHYVGYHFNVILRTEFIRAIFKSAKLCFTEKNMILLSQQLSKFQIFSLQSQETPINTQLYQKKMISSLVYSKEIMSHQVGHHLPRLAFLWTLPTNLLIRGQGSLQIQYIPLSPV